MGTDEEYAMHLLTETMRDEEAETAVRVDAAAALMLWSALESVARHFDESR